MKIFYYKCTIVYSITIRLRMRLNGVMSFYAFRSHERICYRIFVKIIVASEDTRCTCVGLDLKL